MTLNEYLIPWFDKVRVAGFDEMKSMAVPTKPL